MKQIILYLMSSFTAVFVIVDPFAVVPVYLALTARFPPETIAHIRRKATMVAAGILVVFGGTGMAVFHLFGITLPAFQIGGGILLLLLGIAQLNNNRPRVKPEEQEEGMEKEDVSVFPLGMPLLAGPGAISTLVLLSTRTKDSWQLVGLVVATLLAMGAVYLVLKSAHFLYRLLGHTGLNLLTRIMGLILTANGVQFILRGIEGALKAMGVLPK
jgi:multiple antibiotic resistance protein